jgi:hypothetical protein
VPWQLQQWFGLVAAGGENAHVVSAVDASQQQQCVVQCCKAVGILMHEFVFHVAGLLMESNLSV